MMEAGWRPGCPLWCPSGAPCRQALRSHFPVAGDGAIGVSGPTLRQRSEFFIPNMVMFKEWVYPKLASLNGESTDTILELGVHQFQANSHDRNKSWLRSFLWSTSRCFDDDSSSSQMGCFQPLRR